MLFDYTLHSAFQRLRIDQFFVIYEIQVPTRFPEHLVPLQREVQRKLGRNLLRLQQYERLIKALVAGQKLSWGEASLHAAKIAATESLAKKTLGNVVEKLTENFIRPKLDSDAASAADDSLTDPTQPLFSMEFHIEMTQEQFDQTLQRLSGLVALRNELVHHFIEVQDIWTISGCKSANMYLDTCMDEINEHYEELRHWAKGMQVSQELLHQHMNTPECTDFFLHGISPDGTVNWCFCTIVELLRSAEASLARDGWVLLKDAIAYIGEHAPGHNPKKYRCSSWRHVIHESKQFEVRRQRISPELPPETWYRTRLANHYAAP